MDVTKKLSIKEWAEEDRPREKVMLNGIQILSDAELLAIIIGSGSQNESAVELARKILYNTNNNLFELGKLSIKELCKRFHGIGPAKAITIQAAMELGKRRKLAEVNNACFVNDSRMAYENIYPQLSDLPHEEFWVIYLSRNNKIITKKKISQGGVSGTITDIRIILKEAIERLACGMILCHNHPSGNLSPSEQDIQITRKIKEAGKLMEIQLIDHIIISHCEYSSMADNGLL